MSRIYEAIRRADLERRGRQETIPAPGSIETEGPIDAFPVHPDVLIGAISTHAWRPVVHTIPCLLERGEVVEQFRGLRSRLAQARDEAPIRTMLVSSGMPVEGKSFVALNLAISLARESVNRVLLIDCDLRRPTLHKWLGAKNAPGLSEYVAGTADLLGILQRNQSWKIDGLSAADAILNFTFIPAGEYSDNSSELLTNGRMGGLLASLSPHFDWILMDSPPVLAVTDAVDLARYADAVLLVAREACTPFEVAQRAQAAFRQSRLLGFVLNAAKRIDRKKHYYYSSYYSSYYGEVHPDKDGEAATKSLRSR
jgi:protein-tyrosine kinase